MTQDIGQSIDNKSIDNNGIDQNIDRDSEQRDQNENRKGRAAKKSLVAFLRSIKFKKPRSMETRVAQEFAQPQPRTREFEENSRWVPSAN